MSAKSVPNHKDVLGRQLSVGDLVASQGWMHLEVFTVTKLNPKMIQIKPLNSNLKRNKYPVDVVKLDEKDVSFYILKET